MATTRRELYGPNCAYCNKPCPSYVPEYCCNGYECACEGLPIDPCVCSTECWYWLLGEVPVPYEPPHKRGN